MLHNFVSREAIWTRVPLCLLEITVNYIHILDAVLIAAKVKELEGKT